MTLQTFEQVVVEESPDFLVNARTEVVSDPSPANVEQYAYAVGDFVTGLVIDNAERQHSEGLEEVGTRAKFFAGAEPVSQAIRAERYLRTVEEIDQNDDYKGGVISSVKRWLDKRRAYKETLGLLTPHAQYDDLDTLTESFTEANSGKGIKTAAELGSLAHVAVTNKMVDELSPTTVAIEADLKLAA